MKKKNIVPKLEGLDWVSLPFVRGQGGIWGTDQRVRERFCVSQKCRAGVLRRRSLRCNK